MTNRRHGPFRHSMWAIALLALFPASAQAADWVVSRASGQVWVASARAQPASLGTQSTLLAGDTIRTGPNGRVLLVRGEETILVAPNSVVGLPDQSEATATTTILQQAGSIAVKAQKREYNHFEVKTPYLAAVVKGTEFIVTIEPRFADVQVTSGQVQVTELKSGQVALLLPGQAARSSWQGMEGLKLRGAGAFNPVQQGAPGTTTLQPVDVPKTGLGSPPNKMGQHVRALTTGAGRGAANLGKGIVRIVSPIGSARLNVHKVTGGLARSDGDRTHSISNTPLSWNPTVAVGAGNASSSGGGTSGVSANSSVSGNGVGLGLNVGGGSGIGVGVNVGNGAGIGVGVGIGNGPGINVGIGNGTVGINIGNIGIGIGKK